MYMYIYYQNHDEKLNAKQSIVFISVSDLLRPASFSAVYLESKSRLWVFHWFIFCIYVINAPIKSII